MKKKLFLVCLLGSLFCLGQNKISRGGLSSSKTNGASPNPTSDVISETKKGTIIFKESGASKVVLQTKTNGICGILMFDNVKYLNS